MRFPGRFARARGGAVFYGLVLAGATLASATELTALVPVADELPGWRQAESLRTFAHDDLFDLIDGGAELYHEYGFVQALSAQLSGPAAEMLQLEIYEMQSAAAAFGVYSLMQSSKGERLEIGQGALRFSDYLVFWKGPFYVSLTLTRRVGDSASVLTAVAKAIADRIPVSGAAPALIDSLPKAGMLEARYFRGPVALSNVHVFGAGNIFGTGESASGFYSDHQLFVFDYDNAMHAAAQFGAAAAALRADGSPSEPPASELRFQCTDEDGNRLTAFLEGRKIFVHLSVPSAGVVRADER